MKRIFIYIYFVVTVLLLIISCREDIIVPDNLATNVNEPILLNESNSYSFVINAQNISIDVVNNTNFSANTSRISITIVDYSSGYVRIKIIDKQMSVQRKNRGKMVRVALVGYTNVGKSTLMNVVSKSNVFAENKLFATLDTSNRSISLEDKKEFILIDTVGFVSYQINLKLRNNPNPPNPWFCIMLRVI